MANSPHGDSTEGGVLLVADRSPTPSQLSELSQGSSGVRLLDLSPDERVEIGSLPVERLRIDKLLDLDDLHRQFLEFLDRWPRETIVDSRPFDELFRHTTGDSLWWVGPGSQRHPFGGPLLPVMRSLFVLRTACRRLRPSVVVVTTGDRRLATVIRSFCTETGRTLRFLQGSSLPLARPGGLSGSLWTFRTTLSLAALPFWIVIRGLFARLVASSEQETEGRSSLIMSGWYPNHVRDDEAGRPSVWYWRRLAEEIREQRPKTAIRYLLHTTTYRFDGWNRVLRPFYNGWGRLRRLKGALPLTQTQWRLREYFAGAAVQWRLMRLYHRFEASPEFGRSSMFADADCSCLLVTPLRSAVASVAKWSRNVAATAAVIDSVGDVRAVLVHEEFYPKGMLTIAAARQLGLPTVGVQHGSIGPQHTVYMPPPGQLSGAPIPDWFAAYGESAAQILCEQGAFPRDRVLTVGAPRFDHLVSDSLDRATARRELGWSPDTPVVLLTTETFALSGPVYRAVINIARGRPNWKFVVKLHPHDRQPDAYQQLLTSAGVANVELCRDRLRERLSGCDVLVTGYSTTALEGLLTGRSVVCADFTSTPPRYPFTESGVAHSARAAEELQAAIDSALRSPPDDDARREFLKLHVGPTVDASAGQVFASLICERFLAE